jgi:hypothetical protein
MAFKKMEISGYVCRRWERTLRGRVWMFSANQIPSEIPTPDTAPILDLTNVPQQTTRPSRIATPTTQATRNNKCNKANAIQEDKAEHPHTAT